MSNNNQETHPVEIAQRDVAKLHSTYFPMGLIAQRFSMRLINIRLNAALQFSKRLSELQNRLMT